MKTLTVPNEYCSGTCPNEIEVAGRASSTNVADMHDVSGDAVCFRWLSRTVCWVCVWSTALAQQQGSWSRWKTRWVPFHCTSATADLVKSVKDKVSAVPLYQHNSRPCGVHGRWCERQTLWSPWKMGWETQTLWSLWKTRWVPFQCTSTTADLVESMKDEVKDRPCGVGERQGEFHSIVPAQQPTLRSPWMMRVCIVSFHYTGSVISLHVFWDPWMTLTKWIFPLHCTGIALLQPALWSPWMTRWVVPFQCTGVTADLVESMNDKVVSSFSLYWHCSRDCGVHEWQGG